MLEIKNYSKSYGSSKKNHKAVDNLSLTVNDGDIYAFVGHNGAGKTTTIKSIVGILDFDEGNIFINGLSIKEEPLKCKKMMAYIPDNPDLYEHLKGIDYLNFIASIYEVENREELILKYGNVFELTSFLGNSISTYSHGMKQKLAIIAALIHNPKLLVLDEPFVGLDPTSSHKLKEIIKDMASKGAIVFFSTHVLEVAEKLCNKLAIIKDGKLIIEGDMKTVIKNKSLEEVFMELVEHENNA